jgi:hypothetical protein
MTPVFDQPITAPAAWESAATAYLIGRFLKQTRIAATNRTAEGNTMNTFSGAILTAVFALAPAAAYPDSPSGTQRYVEVRGAKLYTQIYGRGLPIVFLHGGMAFFDNSFAKQRDYFATYRTVVGIDQRGYGRTLFSVSSSDPS